MLKESTKRNHGDGTVSFTFTMDADSIVEVRALDRLTTDYDKCIGAINERFDLKKPNPIGTCMCCGRSGKAYRFKFEDGSTKGPYIYCELCVPLVKNIEAIE